MPDGGRHAATIAGDHPREAVLTGARDQRRDDLADLVGGGGNMHALQIGAAADELALVPARLFEQHRQDAADAGRVEVALLLRQQRLQVRRAARPSTGSGTWSLGRGRGRAGARRIFERKRLGKADLGDKVEGGAWKSMSLSPGKPTIRSEDRARSGRASRRRSTVRR